ncbi:MAG: hypothetical protein E7241_04590 [Lachnospiraceae bacterium]|nr:hypothetical protein [Lachnospiraceae bacterium]
MKRKLSVVALVAAVATSLVVLAGCGGSSNSASSAAPASSAAQSSAATDTVIKVPMEVKNETNVTLHKLYVSGAGLDEWGDELLSGQVLKNGESVKLTLTVDKNNLKWDIRAEDSDGTAVEFKGLDISEVSTDGGVITLQETSDGYVATAK